MQVFGVVDTPEYADMNPHQLVPTLRVDPALTSAGEDSGGRLTGTDASPALLFHTRNPYGRHTLPAVARLN